ncbi:Gryzun, putative trafficking through golgi-domain-containing protein [Sparassis latifolia]
MFVSGLDHPEKTQDPFAILSGRLRDALNSQRKGVVWHAEKTKTFQVILVDKDVRFPPRKLLPPEDPQYNASHSPLSPLTPTSPLYPDGLIAPIWIRKHTTLVPSVFVVFTRIFEYVQPIPSAISDAVDAARDRETEERRRDAELATEIAQRKRSTNDRGIKLTVVLMASRRMLDDPSLDARLTYIRRQSGLDPRAALFVLSPVTSSEIGDFVRSLQEALYEPALEYYTNHSKRVRRKRNRHSQITASYAVPHSPIGAANAARPLRSEGWTVRYEYKMACFAEFRGEYEVALKHYQDAYSSLLIMFGSTAILPPRTKRWAEAKVLADCISLKICKLYLYNNEHGLALSHHNNHMRRFADFSRGWGIGDETFEFWSWLARQHRVFAELLEQGTRSTLKLPTQWSSSVAAVPTTQVLDGIQRNLIDVDPLRAMGLNPYEALQHPGFYYYMAARCTERRRQRFLSALEAESSTSTPGYTNEKKVDHLALILELYTRSYELFKKYNTSNGQNQGRLTLWIACLIAQTYHQSGKFDMAVRFFERIAKTYRREKWESLLQPLLSTWYACAQQMGDVELSIRLLFEMLGHGMNIHQDDADAIQEDLLAVLKSSVPSSPDEVFVIDLSDSEPLLNSSMVFWKHDVNVGEAAAFQLSLSSRPGVPMSSLPWTSLKIHFSSHIPPITVRHSRAGQGEKVPPTCEVALGHIIATESKIDGKEVDGVLQWGPGTTTIFAGSVSSDVPTNVKISKLALTMKEGAWSIEVPLHLVDPSLVDLSPSRWLTSLDPVQFIPIRRDHCSTVTIHHRRHAVHVTLSHCAPAYIGEDFPIVLDVTNADGKELDVVVDVLLQPTDIDEVDELNFISLGDERSTSLIKGVSFGVLAPGVSAVKTLYLRCRGVAADRIIDISVQSRTPSMATPSEPASPDVASTTVPADRGEVLHTLIVPALDPIKVEHRIVYRRSLQAQPGLADLQTYEEDFWDDRDGGEAVVTTVMTCLAPSGIVVEDVSLNKEDGPFAKIVASSIEEGKDDRLDEWLPGDELCERCCISLAPDERYSEEEAIAGPGTYQVSWKRIMPDGLYGTMAVTRFHLPSLRPPMDGLIALLEAPSTAKLHNPISLHLTVRNRHPTHGANVIVQLEPDNADGFVAAGLRSGRIPILLPGGEERLMWKLIPIECGYVKLPRIKVTDRRKAVGVQAVAGQDAEVETEGEQVQIVDVRWDGRVAGEAGDAQQAGSSTPEGVQQDPSEVVHPPGQPVVLVLP